MSEFDDDIVSLAKRAAQNIGAVIVRVEAVDGVAHLYDGRGSLIGVMPERSWLQLLADLGKDQVTT